MICDASELLWHAARLAAHDAGARLRLYDWLLSEAAVREGAERFLDAMALGAIGWPTVYAEALAVCLHHAIDLALPMVQLIRH